MTFQRGLSLIGTSMIACCVLLLLVQSVTGFNLKASNIQLTFSAEESLTLKCSHHKAEAFIDTELVQVREMRLVKRVGKRAWQTMTQIWLNDPDIMALGGLDVIGHVGHNVTNSYLTAVWYHTAPDVLGVYRCDIVGTNKNNDIVVEKTNLITVFDSNATTQDMLMSSQQQLENLQLEFNKYRSDTEEKFRTLRSELKEVREAAEYRTNKTIVVSEFVAKLGKQLRAEMQENFETLRAEIRVNTSTCECPETNIKKPEDGTKGGSGKEEGSGQGSASGTGESSGQVGGSGSERSTKKEPVVVPVTTTPYPEPEADDERRNETWPEQKFGLLMPESGCPESQDDDRSWTSGHIGYHTESSEENRDNVSYPHHLAGPVARVDTNGNHFMFLHFCIHGGQAETTPGSVNASEQAVVGPVRWPQGSYCINRAGGRCPNGFRSGYLDIDEEDTGHIKKLRTPLPDMLFFCCRKDGPPARPVRLPTLKPFFLYRYGGECQAVVDMEVTGESITIDTENNNNSDGYENAFHPDGHIEDVHIKLCYYSQ